MANIIEHAKEIAELIKKYNDQDLYQRIVELREGILQLREDNLSLRDEVKSLKQTADVSGRLQREGNCYFLDDDPKKERPYCLTCWDADRKFVNLILSQDRFGKHIRCGICSARSAKAS